MKSATILVCFCLLKAMAATVGQSSPDTAAIEQAIRGDLEHTILPIRGFYTAKSLHYGKDGEPLFHSAAGDWTVEGKAEITQVRLLSDRIEIQGNRVATIWPTPGTAKAVRIGEVVAIRIDLDPAHEDEAEIRRLLGKVFIFNVNELATLVPEYWRDFLTGVRSSPTAGSAVLVKSATTPAADEGNATSNNAPSANLPDGLVPKPSGEVSSGVIQGGLLRSVPPRYPELAKRARLQGNVVLRAVIAKDGSLRQISIYQPVGCGLDEEAVKAVRQWKYKPYVLKGTPVEVTTQITVNFNLAH